MEDVLCAAQGLVVEPCGGLTRGMEFLETQHRGIVTVAKLRVCGVRLPLLFSREVAQSPGEHPLVMLELPTES